MKGLDLSERFKWQGTDDRALDRRRGGDGERDVAAPVQALDHLHRGFGDIEVLAGFRDSAHVLNVFWHCFLRVLNRYFPDEPGGFVTTIF